MSDLRDEPVEVVVTDSDLVYEGRVWDVRSDTFVYGDDEIVRQYVDHPGAAAIVAIDDQQRVLLIQQYRHPIRHRDWRSPRGCSTSPASPRSRPPAASSPKRPTSTPT